MKQDNENGIHLNATPICQYCRNPVTAKIIGDAHYLICVCKGSKGDQVEFTGDEIIFRNKENPTNITIENVNIETE